MANEIEQNEALRYLENAKEILRRIPIEDNDYTDIKPVREAFGTAYLAVLEAVNEALIKKGLHRKQLPKSIQGYMEAIKKYLSVNNGKLIKKFDSLYDSLHIAGYYRGLLRGTNTVKEEFKAAEDFIIKLSKL
ncbi:hypothetical protein MCHI_002396 [Candidatus Magnetoovum chiemensis]|nr:hypothetical protein MCHI_002396 [Candidatus Magnetoovum chiemensis]